MHKLFFIVMRHISKICNFTQKIKKLRKNENDLVAQHDSQLYPFPVFYIRFYVFEDFEHLLSKQKMCQFLWHSSERRVFSPEFCGILRAWHIPFHFSHLSEVSISSSYFITYLLVKTVVKSHSYIWRNISTEIRHSRQMPKLQSCII